MAKPVDTPIVEGDAPRSDGRRRMLAGAVGATSVLMTISSRPALGQSDCANISIQASLMMKTSLHNDCALVRRTGHSANYWVTNTTSWPAPYQAG